MKKLILLTILLIPFPVFAQPISAPIENPKVLISEIFPSPPTGESEWIEIYNYDSKEINLNGLYFLDRGTNGETYGKTKSFLPNIILAPNNYYVFENPKISLNNSGDTITLFDILDRVLDSAEYPSIANSKSFGRKTLSLSSKLEQTLQASKGLENIFEEFKLTPINIAKTLENKSEVNILGISSVNLGILGENIFYIQDETGGIRVELNNLEIEILEGESFQIKGTIVEKYGEKQMSITSISDIIHSPVSYNTKYFNTLPKALSDVGNLFEIESEIVEMTTNGFFIDYPDGKTRVSILENTGIDLDLKKGNRVRILAIFSKYNSSFRLLPRRVEDITILEATSSVKKSKTNSKTLNAIQNIARPNLKMPATIANLGATQKIKLTVYLWPFVLILLIIDFIYIYKRFLSSKIAPHLNKFASLFYNTKADLIMSERYKILFDNGQTPKR